MARIRGRNTAPERRLRAALWASGLRYRLHARTPHGRPDIVFPGKKVAVFIDGCFWHGCPLHYTRPKTKSDFWAKKLRQNVERDQRQTMGLEASGWEVIRIWEHDLRGVLSGIVSRIRDALCKKVQHRSEDLRVIEVRTVAGTGDEIWTLTCLRHVDVSRIEMWGVVPDERNSSYAFKATPYVAWL